MEGQNSSVPFETNSGMKIQSVGNDFSNGKTFDGAISHSCFSQCFQGMKTRYVSSVFATILLFVFLKRRMSNNDFFVGSSHVYICREVLHQPHVLHNDI